MTIQQTEPVIDSLSDRIMLARAALKNAGQVFILTGAGISVESGVPTMNGPGSKWRNHRYTDLAHPNAFARDPMLIWQWTCEWRTQVAACEPNQAHLALARFAKSRAGTTLVTQNVDGLHERAGHPDVIRIHGSLWENRCTACGQERQETSLTYENLPLSPCCGALERPAIVWFEEPVPKDALLRSIQAAHKAVVALVIGTSGVVTPAAAFISQAARHGALIIDVNPHATAVSSHIKIKLGAGAALPSILF